MIPNNAKKKTTRRKRGSVDCKKELMDAVVHLTAKSGIENLPTRVIADTAEGVCGDVYIYTIFGNKENLLLETFLREDEKYASVFKQSINVLWENSIVFENRLRNLWYTMWSWLTVANPETCLFLVRYSCSCYFDETVTEKYHNIWRPISDKLRELLPTTDTARLAETAESLLLNAAFAAIQNRAPISGMVSEKGYCMLEGLFGDCLGSEIKPSKTSA